LKERRGRGRRREEEEKALWFGLVYFSVILVVQTFKCLKLNRGSILNMAFIQ
jgi:hypothetical protein